MFKTLKSKANADALMFGEDLRDLYTASGSAMVREVDLGGSAAAVAAPTAAGIVAYGTEGNDTMIGTTGDDLLMGGGGNDSINGGNGSDLLNGGEGSDTLRGGEGLDKLYGGAGNDLIVGGAGADMMAGGAGDDVYEVDSIFDQVVEATGEGRDRVTTGLDLYTLDANVEDLMFFTPTAHIGNGNTLNNVIEGAYGNDVLRGMDGNDRLTGYFGNDTLEGGNGNDFLLGQVGNDLLWGGPGIDQMFGDVGDDTLMGGTGSDSLVGGDGNDVLNGGGGLDWVTGGAGADRFTFGIDNTGDKDGIMDFQPGIDKIDFRVIDGNASMVGDQPLAFAFMGAHVGGGQASVNYAWKGGDTLLSIDHNGDGVTDFQVALVGQTIYLALADLML